MKTNSSNACPECGTALAAALNGLCPNCLALIGFDGSSDTVAVAPGEGVGRPVLSPTVRYFGDYELLEEIARGGMGVVYRARQKSLNRTVAVKMILSGQLASDSDIRRFYTEAEAAANLQHPNIVAIHEVGEHEGRHYFSMDYVEGKNLAEFAKANPLSAGPAAQLVKTIAEAVQYAHERGTLHRDLKPQNVLIDTHGQPHLTDFGLAKRIARDSGLTQSGALLGSPSYMSPEQAAGRHDQVGPASDVYSLGAILYQLLTGRPPFGGGTPLETVREVVESEPTPPSKLNGKTPADLETICLKCLEKRPEQRYRSAHELADELGRFLSYEPILARPAGRVRKAWGWAQQKPWVMAGVLASLVLVLACLAYGLWEHSRLLGRQLASTSDRLEKAQYVAWRLRVQAFGEPSAGSRPVYGKPSVEAKAAGGGHESPGSDFFFWFPAVCFLLSLFGKSFRNRYRQQVAGASRFSRIYLYIHGAVGLGGTMAGMGYLLVQVRSWVWRPWVWHIFVIELAAALCALVLIGLGFRLVWEALGMHESSRFRSTVDKALERQLASESERWPIYRLVGFAFWLIMAAWVFGLLIFSLLMNQRGQELKVGMLGILLSIGLVWWVARAVRRRLRLFTYVFVPLVLLLFALGIAALTLTSKAFSTTLLFSVLGAIVTLPGLLFIRDGAADDASRLRRFPVNPWLDAAYGIGFFILVFVVFHLEENWRGRRAWERVKAELAAKGESVEYGALVKSPVSADENVMEHPYMKRHFLKGKTNHLPILPLPPIPLETLRKLPRQSGASASGSRDLSDYATSLQGILDWYAGFGDDFAQLEEALQRPHSRIVGDPRNLLAMPIPNLGSFRQAAEAYANLCRVHLLKGDPDAALRDLRWLDRLGEAEFANEPPILIGAMAKVGLSGLLASLLEETIGTGLWPSAHLESIQELCGKVDLLSDLARSVRAGERAGMLQILQAWIDERRALEMLMGSGLAKTNHTSAERWMQRLVIADGWIDQNRANYARLMQYYLEGLDASRGRLDVRRLRAGSERCQVELQANASVGFYMLAALAIPNMEKAYETTARSQTLVNQIVVACALERYRAARGNYPDKLEFLGTEVASRLPHDIFDGKPLRYRRTEDGKYLLYSIGWNSKDDQGQMGRSNNGTAEWQDAKGDWVWQGVPLGSDLDI